MKRFLVPIIFVFLGIAIVSIPNFSSYIDTSSFYFDLTKFLKDYPGFTYPVGITFILGGTAYSFLNIFDVVREKTVFIIQKSDEDDYGNVDLHFPKHTKGNRDELVYENVVTLNNHEKSIVDLEKKKIVRFYNRVEPKKKIAFLAISPMPTLVYAGYTVGDSGRKMAFYHWDRDKAKVVKLRHFGTNEELNEDKTIITNSHDYVLCISTSYLINQETVIKQFNGFNIKFYRLSNPHYNSIKTISSIHNIANYVRDRIAELPSGSCVHLLLSCSSEMCFAIGQKLNSPALPTIKVYNLGKNKNNENYWDWNIDLRH